MQYYQSVFSSLPVIETARLRLRPLTMRDDRDMFRYASDPEVSRHVLWEAHASPRETRSVLRAAIRQYRAGDPSSFAIERLSDHRMIGTIGFMWINCEHRSAEVGYSLSRDCWNQGYATEAVRAACRWAFEQPGVTAVEAETAPDHAASQAVLHRVGFVPTGTVGKEGPRFILRQKP